MRAKPFSIGKNVLYHLIPGAAITVTFLIVVNLANSALIPKALLFNLSAFVMIPVMLFIMKRNSLTGKVMDVVAYQEKLKIWKMVLLGVIAFLWAALIMTVAKQLGASIQDHVFGWMKGQFVLTDYLTNPERYPRSMILITWIVSLLTSSTLFPIIEEFYFRGFLLKGLEKYGFAAVIISSFLFSLYHLFSPWLLLTRFISILPMTYFVWKFKDIRIGILTHILLNLIGDSLFAIPIVFGVFQ